MATAKEQIYDVFKRYPTAWFRTAEIATYLPKLSRQIIYNSLSYFAKSQTLLTKPGSARAGRMYQLNPDAIPFKSGPYHPRTPAIIDTIWTYEERISLAREFIRLRDTKMKHQPAAALIAEMQKILPEARRKPNVTRWADVPWLAKAITETGVVKTTIEPAVTAPQYAAGILSAMLAPRNEPAQVKVEPAPVAPEPHPKPPTRRGDILDQISNLEKRQASREVEKKPVEPFNPLQAATLDQLLDEIGRRVANSFRQAFTTALSEKLKNEL